MIDYDEEFNSMAMTCDTCEDIGIFEGADFIHCIDKFKDDGWQVHYLEDKTYEHVCPDCVIKKIEDNMPGDVRI